jgi:hypothetical protein
MPPPRTASAPTARPYGSLSRLITSTSIVDVAAHTSFAYEVLVRGPVAESALSVLLQMTERNRYRFDQTCCVKALKTVEQLGMYQRLSSKFLPNAVNRPG